MEWVERRLDAGDAALMAIQQEVGKCISGFGTAWRT